MDYNGFLILSDFDGTLSRNGMYMNHEEIEAINKFTSLGGKFGVATGRGLRDVQAIFQKAALNAPAVLCNGAVIIDTKENKLIKDYPLQGNIKEIIDDIVEKFPKLVIQAAGISEHFTIYTGDCKDELLESFKQFLEIGVDAEKHSIDFINSITNKFVQLQEIHEPLYKIMAIGGANSILELKLYLKNKYKNDDYIITSSAPFNVEFNAKEASKGQAGAFIRSSYYKDEKLKVIALGDGENDIDALDNADYSFVAAQASEMVKSHGDYILKPKKGVINQVLEFIHNGTLKK